jgi:hypothetical protein
MQLAILLWRSHFRTLESIRLEDLLSKIQHCLDLELERCCPIDPEHPHTLGVYVIAADEAQQD